MQLNMLNDLAKAMKALDGKKAALFSLELQGVGVRNYFPSMSEVGKN